MTLMATRQRHYERRNVQTVPLEDAGANGLNKILADQTQESAKGSTRRPRGICLGYTRLLQHLKINSSLTSTD